MNVLGRVLLLVVGIAMMSTGVSLTVFSGLGTTPGSAPAVTIAAIAGVSVGTISMTFNVFYVVSQMLLLRRRYQWVQVLQLATGALFSSIIDVSSFTLRWLGVNPSNYLEQVGLAILGTLAMGIGIGFQVHAKLINLPPEGFVLAITTELRRIVGPNERLHFGNVKVASDLTHVALATVLSVLFLGGLVGVREGTVVAALTLGYIAQGTLKVLNPQPGTAQ